MANSENTGKPLGVYRFGSIAYIKNIDIYSIAKDYKKGISVRQLSKKYRIEQHRLSIELKKIGIKVRPNWKYYDYEFKLPEKNNLYWFLGIMATDGYVHDKFIAIELHKRDKDILESIKRICESNHPLKLRKNRPHYCLRLPKPFATLCRKHGIYQNKSKTIKFVDMEDKYFFDFLCGCIDGDGSIRLNVGKTTKSICMYLCSSSMDFLQGINVKLKHFNLSGKIKKQKDKEFYKLFWGTRDTPNLCKLMYKNNYGGKRKCKLYKNWMEVMPKP